MAHIIYRPAADGLPAMDIMINGHDFSSEIYSEGARLVTVGKDEFAEVGFQVTFVVSRLDLGGAEDVPVTNHFRSVAQRVRRLTKKANA